MTVSIVTLFPDLYKPFLDTSIVKRAQEQQKVAFEITSLFSYVAPKERVDAPTFGHGSGMLIRPDVVERAINAREAASGKAYKIFFSPQGEKVDADVLKELYRICQEKKHLMLLPARYEGMDSRVEHYYADKVISIGDFVLMGGDLPAMMVLEGLLRFIPGVVGKQESVEQDSFMGAFVDYPEYTAPVEWKGIKVPEVIRSGNHKEIARWRKEMAARKSALEHFEWVRSHPLSAEEKKLVESYIPPHYAILMHNQVILPNEQEGCTSVTSLDIHDIARSACTYGLKGYFIVTPLADQQKIIKKLLSFWASPEGEEYNPHRHSALERVFVVSSLDEALAGIVEQEAATPLLMGTSARAGEFEHHQNAVTYYDQKKVWALNRPVAFIFGTGRGLAQSVLMRCDFMLPPVKGFAEFNHLSVRSAAAIVFDRWLGSTIKKINTPKFIA
jgi:tRNA (guanine37-N1)-methyltransferase